jgi:hypothetical protein
MEVFFEKFLRMPVEMMFPPGYTSIESFKGLMAAKKQNFQRRTAETLIEQGMFACGSPRTVRDILAKRYDELGFGYMLPMLQFATLPADLTRKNMELFGREVLPHLQALSSNKARVAAE